MEIIRYTGQRDVLSKLCKLNLLKEEDKVLCTHYRHCIVEKFYIKNVDKIKNEENTKEKNTFFQKINNVVKIKKEYKNDDNNVKKYVYLESARGEWLNCGLSKWISDYYIADHIQKERKRKRDDNNIKNNTKKNKSVSGHLPKTDINVFFTRKNCPYAANYRFLIFFWNKYQKNFLDCPIDFNVWNYWDPLIVKENIGLEQKHGSEKKVIYKQKIIIYEQNNSSKNDYDFYYSFIFINPDIKLTKKKEKTIFKYMSRDFDMEIKYDQWLEKKIKELAIDLPFQQSWNNSNSNNTEILQKELGFKRLQFSKEYNSFIRRLVMNDHFYFPKYKEMFSSHIQDYSNMDKERDNVKQEFEKLHEKNKNKGIRSQLLRHSLMDPKCKKFQTKEGYVKNDCMKRKEMYIKIIGQYFQDSINHNFEIIYEKKLADIIKQYLDATIQYNVEQKSKLREKYASDSKYISLFDSVERHCYHLIKWFLQKYYYNQTNSYLSNKLEKNNVNNNYKTIKISFNNIPSESFLFINFELYFPAIM